VPAETRDEEEQMEHRVELPPLGDDAPDEAEVSFWYVAPGEEVEAGADLLEMITDKAAFTVPSPVAGTVKELLAEEGEKVKVGQGIVVIEG
jgi:pyruvate dehydrogenase E2 component (dihydrolipoamide acetyltransferase)